MGTAWHASQPTSFTQSRSWWRMASTISPTSNPFGKISTSTSTTSTACTGSWNVRDPHADWVSTEHLLGRPGRFLVSFFSSRGALRSLGGLERPSTCREMAPGTPSPWARCSTASWLFLLQSLLRRSSAESSLSPERLWHSTSLVHGVPAMSHALGTFTAVLVWFWDRPTASRMEGCSLARAHWRVDGLCPMAKRRAVVLAAFRLVVGGVEEGSARAYRWSCFARWFRRRAFSAATRMEGDLWRLFASRSAPRRTVRRLFETVFPRDALLVPTWASELDSTTVARLRRFDPAAEEARYDSFVLMHHGITDGGPLTHFRTVDSMEGCRSWPSESLPPSSTFSASPRAARRWPPEPCSSFFRCGTCSSWISITAIRFPSTTPSPFQKSWRTAPKTSSKAWGIPSPGRRTGGLRGSTTRSLPSSIPWSAAIFSSPTVFGPSSWRSERTMEGSSARTGASRSFARVDGCG